MELDELKSNWQYAGDTAKNQSELHMMTKIKNHPKLKRIRIKLIIESILLIVFLLVFNDFFDAQTKPFWVNALLIVSVVLFVVNDVVGLMALQNPIYDTNITQSLNKLTSKLKRLSMLSMATSFFFGMSIILFLTITINFTNGKYVMLTGILLTLLGLMYASYKNWKFRIQHFEKVLQDFKE
ncbi:hypothetical protein JYT76_04005 [Olleya sp. AH-315-F22]|nr:hypothetical protein [Olleya sp. AH-315-F22]